MVNGNPICNCLSVLIDQEKEIRRNLSSQVFVISLLLHYVDFWCHLAAAGASAPVTSGDNRQCYQC